MEGGGNPLQCYNEIKRPSAYRVKENIFRGSFRPPSPVNDRVNVQLRLVTA